MRSFQDLEVWQKAGDLAEAAFRLTERIPPDDRYGLTSQLRLACRYSHLLGAEPPSGPSDL